MMNFKQNSNVTLRKSTEVNIWLSNKTSNFYKIPKTIPKNITIIFLSSIRDNYKKGDVSVVNSINKIPSELQKNYNLKAK